MRSAVLLVLGLLIGLVVVAPVSAHHTPRHTKRQIKALNRKINALRSTVTGVQGTVNNLNQLQYITSSVVVVPDGSFGQAEAVCPSGTFVTGGGGVADGDWFQVDSYPSHGVGFPPPTFFAPQGRTAWAFEGVDLGGDGFPSDIRAYAICSRVGSVNGNYSPGTIPLRGAQPRIDR